MGRRALASGLHYGQVMVVRIQLLTILILRPPYVRQRITVITTYFYIFRLGSCQTYQLLYGHTFELLVFKGPMSNVIFALQYFFRLRRENNNDTSRLHKSFNYLRSFYVQDRSCALAFRP